MAAREILWLDSDIILDQFLRREPWCSSAEGLLVRGASGGMVLVTSALVLANVFYVHRRVTGKHGALDDIKKLMQFVDIADIGLQQVVEALASGHPDFEDALQMATAETVPGLSAIITRNKPDYAAGRIPILTAEEWLAAHPPGKPGPENSG